MEIPKEITIHSICESTIQILKHEMNDVCVGVDTTTQVRDLEFDTIDWTEFAIYLSRYIGEDMMDNIINPQLEDKIYRAETDLDDIYNITDLCSDIYKIYKHIPIKQFDADKRLSQPFDNIAEYLLGKRYFEIRNMQIDENKRIELMVNEIKTRYRELVNFKK